MLSHCSLGSLRLPLSSEDPSEAPWWVLLLPVLSWYTISLIIASSFYEDLILSGGSISDFRPNLCVALEVLTSIFVETDNFFED
jgi:hypothetical protein